MRNFVKLILILCLCVSLLAMVGCGKQAPTDANGTTGGTTVPQESQEGTTPEDTTTEKPVNIVEDPLNNGEGDPLDAIDGTTTGDGKPGIDIEVDDDGGNQNATTPTEGNAGSQGGSTETTGATGSTESDDDFKVDFGDLLG